MNILIVGGAGHLGSHLCEKLIKDNNIHCLDTMLSGSFDNIKHLSRKDNFTLSLANIVTSELDYLGTDFDYILHLASPASPTLYKEYPLFTLETNTIGTKKLLDLAQTCGARLIFTSTSEVYGDPLEHPQKETYFGNVNCYGPRSMYDEGKRAGEAIVRIYQQQGVNAGIVRLFNTYGPRMKPDDGRVVPNFIVSALEDKKIELHNAGLQTRSFCYVDDTVDGIIKYMESDETEPMNIGNPDEITIKDLAVRVKTLCDSKSKLIIKPPRDEEDPSQRCPDIGRAKRIKFKPKVSLNDGLEKTINYFKSQ